MTGLAPKPHLAFVGNDPLSELRQRTKHAPPIKLSHLVPISQVRVPIAPTHTSVVTTRLPIATQPTKVERQREHWRLAHTRPIEVVNLGEAWNLEVEEHWYASWRESIPRSCGCTWEWAALTKQHPPDFSSPLSMAIWFWKRHNEVNARLRAAKGGHPHFSWAECCQTYNYLEDWIVASE